MTSARRSGTTARSAGPRGRGRGDFLDLFEPDSGFAAETVELWRKMAAEGRRTVPYDEDHPSGGIRSGGPVMSVSAEEAGLPVCSVRHNRVLGSDDVVDEAQAVVPEIDNGGGQ